MLKVSSVWKRCVLGVYGYQKTAYDTIDQHGMWQML